jgi:hypothetical protein
VPFRFGQLGFAFWFEKGGSRFARCPAPGDDETADKMGHPVVRGDFYRTAEEGVEKINFLAGIDSLGD